MKIVFERLPRNNNPIPVYATQGSAAFDLSTCLRRSCRQFLAGRGTINFRCTTDGGRRDSDEEGNLREIGNCDTPVLRINPGEIILIPTGFKTSFVNAVLKIYVRSSISLDGLQLSNNVGIIDSDYRGELFLAFKNTTDKVKNIPDNYRMAQGILEPLEQCIIEEGTVDITIRGTGGFGSTNE